MTDPTDPSLFEPFNLPNLFALFRLHLSRSASDGDASSNQGFDFRFCPRIRRRHSQFLRRGIQRRQFRRQYEESWKETGLLRG